MGTIEYAGTALAEMPSERALAPVEGEQYPVFVYGRSKSGFESHGKIASYLATTGVPAVMPGAIMAVNERFPFILCVGGESDMIMGELLTLNPAIYDAALARLDRANDIDGTDRPTNFVRMLTTIYTFDRKPHTAWVYVVGKRLTHLFGETPIIQSGWWTPETHREAWDIFTGAVDGEVVAVRVLEAPAEDVVWDMEMT